MKRAKSKLSDQIKNHVFRDRSSNKTEYDGNIGTVISTGSTLLDLAISGERVRGGGIPGGIMVEGFGPEGAGKTVLLCEIGGDIQRKGGQDIFLDPEARLNKRFAEMFGINIGEAAYDMPDTVEKMFDCIKNWEPEPDDVVHGILADSLAALTTEMEIEGSDKYGMRRAKEFSEGLRLRCREIRQKNLLLVCSNQVRTDVNSGPYGPPDESPGGRAIKFYSSLRLRFHAPKKNKVKKTIHGKKVERTIGIDARVYVAKSTVGKPYREAIIPIIFDYGIDDIRANLQFIKDNKGSKVYTLGKEDLSNSMDKAIEMIEQDELEQKLKDEVINLWESIEAQFASVRRPKRR